MWRVIWFFLGVTRLQVTGASPEWCLQRLAKARVPFHFCGKPDAFTAGIWILRRDEARVTRLVCAAGCECHVEERGGFPAIFGGLQRRLWLPVLLLAAAAAAVIVPKFVFSTLSRATRPSRRRRSCASCRSSASDSGPTARPSSRRS